MKLQARLNRIETKLQPVEEQRVIIYHAATGKCTHNWQPGMTHKGVVIIRGDYTVIAKEGAI